MQEIDHLRADLEEIKQLKILPKKKLCVCGRKPKMTSYQIGFKDDDCFYILKCEGCGKKYGGKDVTYYDQFGCVIGWNRMIREISSPLTAR